MSHCLLRRPDRVAVRLHRQEQFRAAQAARAVAADIDRLTVTCDSDGSITIAADSRTAARLAGRSEFGPVAPVQAVLEDRIADAWYAADCPADTTGGAA